MEQAVRTGSRANQAGEHGDPSRDVELGDITTRQPVEDNSSNGEQRAKSNRTGRSNSGTYDVPASYININEAPPEQRPAEPSTQSGVKPQGQVPEVSKFATQVYTHSWLVFFAIFGTLARLGLTALTRYPDTPIIFNTVWSNFTGSLIMGFLAEDRKLFRDEWGTAVYDNAIKQARKRVDGEEEARTSNSVDLGAAKRAHMATKKTIPLYVGLATGFCGSFTTFSGFIKDTFLALSNDMPSHGRSTSLPRNGGYSFLAMLAVIITTVSLSISGLRIGAHAAIALERVTPSLPFSTTRKFIDPLGMIVGWGCWLGAVLLAIFPPSDKWRGQALFSLVFAPLGCLLRFYMAQKLNGKSKSFPFGTFGANVLGTAVLGMAWDIAHVPIGGVVGCQVLQGVEDGFCGCLTTISTWVLELTSLRRGNGWVYGTVSFVVSLAIMIAIMGGLRWSDGYSELVCVV